MLYVLSLFCSLTSVPLSSDPVPVELDLRVVTGKSRRDVACAQRPLDPFVQGKGGADWWRTSLPRADGPIALTLWPRELADEASRDRLWVDVNRDGVETSAEVLTLERRDGGNPYVFQELTSLGLALELMVYEKGESLRATAMTHYHIACDVEIDGEAQRLIVLDKDLDGRASQGDVWVALSQRQLEFVHLPSMLFAANLASEPWYFGDRTLRLSLGDEPSATLAPAAKPRHVFLAERAARVNEKTFRDYDKGRASFLASYEISPDRPVDPSPPLWHHAWDLDEALALAKAAGKPLWVEFTSDGCPWCKRYDWLNDRDAEVTKRLRRFTLVKIMRDLDPDQTAVGLGMEGVPCHAVFDHAGESPFHATGWVPPRDHVKRLEAALDAVTESSQGG
ncbi:MAG: thioredoxin family protein [Planctomycetota bacterium]